MGSNYQIELIELIDFPGLMNRTWFVTGDGIVGIFVETLATNTGSRALDGSVVTFILDRLFNGTNIPVLLKVPHMRAFRKIKSIV